MALELFPVAGIGEIIAGDDLAAVILTALDRPLTDGDVVVVTSKVVSKAHGLATKTDRDALIETETERIVAQRGPTRIVRTHHGLTLAAAGIDASNIRLGEIIPLPADPDQVARDLRQRLEEATESTLAVIITDTAGRAWRIGQTDIAIGASGIATHLDFAGTTDSYGNLLAVTVPAIADEIAGASDLVAGKLGGVPVVIVRGIPAEWLGPDRDEGATALIRDEDQDLFGLGARDAVIAALGTGELPRGFPAGDGTLESLLATARTGIDLTQADVRQVDGAVQVFSPATAPSAADWIAVGALAERVRVLARAMQIPIAVAIQDLPRP